MKLTRCRDRYSKKPVYIPDYGLQPQKPKRGYVKRSEKSNVVVRRRGAKQELEQLIWQRINHPRFEAWHNRKREKAAV